jgi:hypothetical protein
LAIASSSFATYPAGPCLWEAIVKFI